MKNLTKTILAFAAAAGLLTVSTTWAAPGDGKEADPETTAAAKTLMETLKVKEQMAPAFEGVKKMQAAMLDQQQLSEDQKAAAKEVMAASMDEVMKAMSWDNLENMMIRIYADVFIKSELEDLNALFQSPAGQTFIKKQPELQAATMKEIQTIMVDLMPQIQKSTQEAIERVKNQQN